MTTTWTIAQLERTLDDGGVVVAHWRATATDGDFSATNYGTCGFTPDPSSSDWVDYESISEELALSWCWANGVDKDAIEASLAANIEAQKNPTQASGVPW
jgi:hypothetical protein